MGSVGAVKPACHGPCGFLALLWMKITSFIGQSNDSADAGAKKEPPTLASRTPSLIFLGLMTNLLFFLQDPIPQCKPTMTSLAQENGNSVRPQQLMCQLQRAKM
jgi:hypothetical protein